MKKIVGFITNLFFSLFPVNKNKIIWPKKRVTKVYELPVNYFDYKLNTKFEVIK